MVKITLEINRWYRLPKSAGDRPQILVRFSQRFINFLFSQRDVEGTIREGSSRMISACIFIQELFPQCTTQDKLRNLDFEAWSV